MLQQVFVDPDAVHKEPIIELVDGKGNCLIYQTLEDPAPIFSFVELDPVDATRVVKIQEKVKISNHANVGVYSFASKESFCRAAETVLDKALAFKGEFYISCVYAEMLLENVLVQAFPIKEYVSLGTPKQVIEYLRDCLSHPAMEGQAVPTSGEMHTHALTLSHTQ
jgi:dTDP-glucose pyrophosphorylase